MPVLFWYSLHICIVNLEAPPHHFVSIVSFRCLLSWRSRSDIVVDYKMLKQTFYFNSLLLLPNGFPMATIWQPKLYDPDERKRTFWRAYKEDSNQTAHPRSLIWVFVVRIEELHLWLSKNARSEDPDQIAWICWPFWIFNGRTCPKVLFLTLRPEHQTFLLRA